MGLYSFALDSFVSVEGIFLQTQMGTDALRLHRLARMTDSRTGYLREILLGGNLSLEISP